MKNYKILFSDLDGTLIKTKSGETFPKDIWDMELRFDVLDAIKKLNPKYVFIVSNQGGIESGFVEELSFRYKIDYVTECVKSYCNTEADYNYCKSNDKQDKYRKPNTGMLDTFIRDEDKKFSLMIGDASGKEGQFSDTDKKTAENFGIDYIDVDDFVRYWED